MNPQKLKVSIISIIFIPYPSVTKIKKIKIAEKNIKDEPIK